MSFEKQKEKYLQNLFKVDKSKKGSIDTLMIPLITSINEIPYFVTTSSCSGRITLLTKNEDSRKNEVSWPFVSHEAVTYNDILKAAKETVMRTKDTIWLKMESPILHVSAKTIEAGAELVDMGFKCGFKYAGIFSIKPERIMVQIFGTEKIETVIAKDGELLSSEKELEVLIDIANTKLKKSHVKLRALEKEIKNYKKNTKQ